jgi:hypothetical protein
VTLSTYVILCVMGARSTRCPLPRPASSSRRGFERYLRNYSVTSSGKIGFTALGTGVLICCGGTLINNLGASITDGVIGVNLGQFDEGQDTHTHSVRSGSVIRAVQFGARGKVITES